MAPNPEDQSGRRVRGPREPKPDDLQDMLENLRVATARFFDATEGSPMSRDEIKKIVHDEVHSALTDEMAALRAALKDASDRQEIAIKKMTETHEKLERILGLDGDDQAEATKRLKKGISWACDRSDFWATVKKEATNKGIVAALSLMAAIIGYGIVGWLQKNLPGK